MLFSFFPALNKRKGLVPLAALGVGNDGVRNKRTFRIESRFCNDEGFGIFAGGTVAVA